MPKLTYEKWMQELHGIAMRDDCVIAADPSWREMWADGMTPQEAWDEDLAAGADCTVEDAR